VDESETKSEAVKISPSYTLADLVNDRVTPLDVLQDQIERCILQFATALVSQEHSGVAVLLLCCSPIETLGRITTGSPSGSDSRAFIEGCGYIFGNSAYPPKTFKLLWRSLRCGLYHDGFVKFGVGIGHTSDSAIAELPSGTLIINPSRFCEAVGAAFQRFFSDARTSIETSKKFADYYRASKDQYTRQSPNDPPMDLNSSTVTIAPATISTLSDGQITPGLSQAPAYRKGYRMASDTPDRDER
jgi:hypothetical protein